MAAPMRKFIARVAVEVCRPFGQDLTLPTYRLLACKVSYHSKLLVPNVLQSFRRPLVVTARRWVEETEENTRPIRFKKEITDDDVEEGIAYLQSEEYAEKYGGKPVWANYRRNHKGQVPRMKTRKSCIRGQSITGNPCPICRDQGLIVHYKNVKLLEQFVNPASWIIFEPQQTGLCQKVHKKMVAAVEKARDHGLMPFTVPYVMYDYGQFYPSHSKEQQSTGSS